MAVHLSRLAKNYIADFVNHRDVIMLPGDWREMYEVFSSGGVQRHRMPAPEYAASTEFDLCLRKDVSAEAVEYLFTEGSEAVFWYKVPTGLISTLVKAHSARNTVHSYESMQEQVRRTPTYIIEVFHIKNTTTAQAMTIELWFDSFGVDFMERFGSFPANGRVQKCELRRVKIYAGGCSKPVPNLVLSARPLRRKLLAEVLLEAYRFLDRYSLDVSQLVCDEWRGSIERSSEQLALYPITADFKHEDCERKRERMGGQFYGVLLNHEWEATFANYSGRFLEVNSRHFHFVNAQPPANSSAVIRRHLRNAFVKHMSFDVMMRDFEWTVGMLLGLSASTLVEKLEVLFMREECLALLDRFEEALIRRNVQKLNLTILDPLLKALVDHHNFFGRPSIQQLRKLELHIQHLDAPLEPYWLPAIYEPSERRHVAVHYQPEKHAHNTVDVSRVHAALCRMLEDFETSGRDLAVDRFSLTSYSGIPSLVDNRKPAFEGIPIPTISFINTQRWNVYYFETADKQKCLTLFVPPEEPHRPLDIHVKRGKTVDFV